MCGWDFRFDAVHGTAGESARDDDGHTNTARMATSVGQVEKAQGAPFTADFDARVAEAQARVKRIAKARTCTLQRVAAETKQLTLDSGVGGEFRAGELHKICFFHLFGS